MRFRPLGRLFTDREGLLSPGSEKASAPLGPDSQEEVRTFAWVLSKQIKFCRIWPPELVCYQERGLGLSPSAARF